MKTDTIILGTNPSEAIQQWINTNQGVTINFILGDMSYGQVVVIFTE